VAIQLGVSTTYLYRHFPKLCEKYKCKRTPIHLSKEVLLTELKSVISVKQVAKVIGVSPQLLYGRHSEILKEFTRKMDSLLFLFFSILFSASALATSLCERTSTPSLHNCLNLRLNVHSETLLSDKKSNPLLLLPFTF
jgi:hypothetical protein